MQETVKVFTPEVLVAIFGHVKVKGDFTYKLQLDSINSRELSELAKVNEDYGMNFHIKRSGKGLAVFSPFMATSKYNGTIRHYFETCLSDGERINAFDNTPKSKWNIPVKDAFQALDIAFDFATSPQGCDYWNEIVQRLMAVPKNN